MKKVVLNFLLNFILTIEVGGLLIGLTIGIINLFK